MIVWYTAKHASAASEVQPKMAAAVDSPLFLSVFDEVGAAVGVGVGAAVVGVGVGAAELSHGTQPVAPVPSAHAPSPHVMQLVEPALGAKRPVSHIWHMEAADWVPN